MKTLNTFIIEKLKISSKSVSKPFSLSDFNINIHKYKLAEIKNLVNAQNESYVVNFVFADEKVNTLDITDFDLLTGLEEFRDSWCVDHNTKNALSIEVNSKNAKQYSIKDILSKTNSPDNQIFRPTLIDGVKASYSPNATQTQFYLMNGYNNCADCVVYDIKIDDNAKIIKIYVCADKNFNSVNAKLKAASAKSDYEYLRSENFFDLENEENRQADIDNADNKYDIILKDIPNRKKYNKDGKAYLFIKIYITLALYGEMTKQEAIETVNSLTGKDYSSTSYATLFAKWNRDGQIKRNKNKLYPVKYDNWIIK